MEESHRLCSLTVIGHLQLPLPGGRGLWLLPHHLLCHRVGGNSQHLLAVLHGKEEGLPPTTGLQVAVLVRHDGDDPLTSVLDHSSSVLQVRVQGACSQGLLRVSCAGLVEQLCQVDHTPLQCWDPLVFLFF